MPSNRAVLRDIADLGLDPSVAHRHTKANGRIPAPAPAEPLKSALQKLPEKKVEAPKAVEKPAEEPKKEEAPVVEAKVEAKPEKAEKPAKKEKAPKPVPAAEPAPVAEADDAKKA